MVRSPERPVALHAATALHALTAGHADGQVALQECGGIQVLIAAYFRQWQHFLGCPESRTDARSRS